MNILIADDHSLMRELFAAVLSVRFPGGRVDEAHDLDEARASLSGSVSYDILLIDLQMPGMDGIESAIELAKEYPSSKTIVVTGNDDPRVAYKALRSGLAGYVPKSMGVDATVNAVKLVLSGETYVPALVLKAMARGTDPVAEPDQIAEQQKRVTANDLEASENGFDDEDQAGLDSLTDRELAVLLAISQGMSNKEIARKFDIAEITVKVHAQGIYRKLGVTNRTQAAAKYLSAS